ncbi:hypothetical protein KUTeg_018684 [Tegillarca granosa]|uniref:Uncharacterized protein n=1 Tax=Tegillarca granosa TaxID=220873 RepID=A0ABQ9EIR2_TEGGR|nr:hypothetical protein KUTeg_018684 [Tegillarca granosa]
MAMIHLKTDPSPVDHVKTDDIKLDERLTESSECSETEFVNTGLMAILVLLVGGRRSKVGGGTKSLKPEKLKAEPLRSKKDYCHYYRKEPKRHCKLQTEIATCDASVQTDFINFYSATGDSDNMSVISGTSSAFDVGSDKDYLTGHQILRKVTRKIIQSLLKSKCDMFTLQQRLNLLICDVQRQYRYVTGRYGTLSAPEPQPKANLWAIQCVASKLREKSLSLVTTPDFDPTITAAPSVDIPIISPTSKPLLVRRSNTSLIILSAVALANCLTPKKCMKLSTHMSWNKSSSSAPEINSDDKTDETARNQSSDKRKFQRNWLSDERFKQWLIFDNDSCQAADDVSYLKKYREILTTMFYHFKHSSLRTANLSKIEEVLDKQLKIKEIHSVGWFAFFSALEAVFHTWGSLVTYFEQEKQCEKGGTAKGIHTQLVQFEFVAVTYLLMDIMPILTKLSLSFQKENLDIALVQPLNDGHYMHELHFAMSDNKLELRNHTVSFTKNKLTHVENVKKDFISGVITQIRRRFPVDDTSVIGALAILGLRGITFVGSDKLGEHGKDEIDLLCSKYGSGKPDNEPTYVDELLKWPHIFISWGPNDPIAFNPRLNTGGLPYLDNENVKKFIKSDRPDIKHYFDVWHMDKGVNSKLKKGKIKDCGYVALCHVLLATTTSSIGNREIVLEKWLSILYHVVDIHEGHGNRFPECVHNQLEDRAWMKEGSMLLKDMQKLSPAEQTSSLESFHKVVCFFAP